MQDLIRPIAGFEDAIRKFVCHVVGITYQVNAASKQWTSVQQTHTKRANARYSGHWSLLFLSWGPGDTLKNILAFK